MKLLRNRKLIALLATLALATTAVAGYAYFTAAGAGTGTAAVGSSSTFTVHGDVTGNLYPAGPALTVPVTVTNTSTGAQKVGTVTLDSITTTQAGCDTSLNGTNSAFTFVNPVTINQDLAAGATSTAVNGSLQMNDTGVSQDNCQGAPLVLHFSEQAAA
jgi:hypothetical protein